MPSAITQRVAILTIGILGACSSSEPPRRDLTCEQDASHCDLPKDPKEVSCTRRRTDAFNENRLAFNEPFLRWSCADVQGVTENDRGQEYCEYFAVAKLPPDGTNPAPAPVVLGKNLGEKSSNGTTPAAVTLTPSQITALEADETQVVGSCMFTSWNSDIPKSPPPVPCGGPSQPACPSVFGLPIDELFRMTFKVNSTIAGQLLVEDCFTNPTPGDAKNPRDLRHDDFLRGCLWDAEINKTEFRKSDTTVCASMARLAECGCDVTGSVGLSELVSPWDKRGFPLGGWAGPSKLPANCRYVDLGDASQTLVACDLTAADLLYGAADMKSYCQDKYADTIVVHVPIPKASVTCDPKKSTSPYAGTCSATPWVVTPSAPSGS